MSNARQIVLHNRCALVAALAVGLLLGLGHLSSSVKAQEKKRGKYGTLKLQTNPAGFPLAVDGQPSGQTTTDYRDFDLAPGVHTIGLTLPNGQNWTREIDIQAGRIKCVALNYRNRPLVESPCPYPVNVSAPTTVNDGDIITFTADVTYGGRAPLNYTWSVTPSDAKILSGAGTRTISIESTGLSGQRVVATVVVDDGSGDALCRQRAQAATFVPPVVRENPAKQFDVCCDCAYDDQKARLDNLAINLQSEPTASAYIFVYRGRTSPQNQVDRLSARIRDYLVTQRGLSASRFVIANGGFREQDCVELWIVPTGASPPTPTPTIQPRDIKPTERVKPRRPRGV